MALASAVFIGSSERSQASEGPSSSEMLEDLPEELLRSVTLAVALGGFGKEWRQSDPSFGKWRPHLTKQTQRFDYFLSHDWGTSGWMKYFSLLIFFNSRASALVTLLFISLLGVLSGMELLPKTVWWLILGQVVALLVLLFWQHLRHLCKMRERVFVDSLCIPQHDETLKSQCIYGLASFLKRSETLLVLWSPRYCTRLWCMYELGCFLMKQKGAKHILFLPVQMSVLWLLCYLQVAAIFATALIGQRVDSKVFSWQEVTGKLSLSAVILTQVLVLYPAYFYIMNSMLADMNQLPRLFEDFDLEAAECFCCSCQHRHPTTLVELPCDRQLIYESLQHWSGESDDIRSVFKTHLDEHVMPSVERTFQSSALFMRPLLSAALVASCPFLCDFISVEFTKLVMKVKGNRIRNAGLPVYVFFVSLCLVRCSLLLGRLGVRWKQHPRCAVLFQVLAFLCTGQLLGMGYPLAVAVGSKKFKFTSINLLPFLLLCIVMIWSICVYQRALSTWSRMSLVKAKAVKKNAKKEVTDGPMSLGSPCSIDSGSTIGI